MYLDDVDKEIILEFLSKNKERLKSLEKIVFLKTQYDNALATNGMEFHDDIHAQFFGVCKTIIAEDVSRNTGLSADGIIYILDYMGLDKFQEYLYGKRRKKMGKHKPSTTKKSGNGSQRK